MESLGKIFGNKHRVKIMRLFLFNASIPFDAEDVSTRSKVKLLDARKELTMLMKIGFLKKKSFSIKLQKPIKKKDIKATFKTIKKNGWVLNTKFDLIRPLQMLLLDSELINEKEMVKRLKKGGSLKLLLLSGLFTRDDERKLDILIVGNKLKKDVLEKEIKIIESEIGRELRYASFDESEFNYRVSMYDKLIRDILEHDHKKLVNQLSN
ncbi:MAG: hypothetical protein ACI870_000146 [Crocinitomicaceae bacterium]|jgi:hypothetical protein